MTDTIIQSRIRGMPPPRVRRRYYQGYRDPDPVERGADTAAARAESILNAGGWLAEMSTAVLEKPLTMPVRVSLPPARRDEGGHGGGASGLVTDPVICSLREVAKYRPGLKVGKGTAWITSPKKVFAQQIREVDLFTGEKIAQSMLEQITHALMRDLPGQLDAFAKEVPQLKLTSVPASEALPKISDETHERILGNGRPPTLFAGAEAWKMLSISETKFPGFSTRGERIFGVNLHKTSLLPARMVIGSGNLQDGLAAACSPIAFKRDGKTVVFASKYAWAVTSPEEFRRYEIIPDEQPS